MRELGFVAKTKKRYRINTTNSNHNLSVAPNILNRDFYASYPGVLKIPCQSDKIISRIDNGRKNRL
jgi:transposase InsO family protein